MPSRVPALTAEIVFLTPEEGGRSTPPMLDGSYMPHIVMQERRVRQAVLDSDGVSREDYQGVRFIRCSSSVELGQSGTYCLELMYFPSHSYASVQPGGTFTLREGRTVVGHGVVLSRQ